MFLAGIAQCYQESTKGNLLRWIKSIKQICDHVFVYDDGSTDDSVKIMVENGISVFMGGPNDFANEIAHKAYLLQHVLEAGPSHILWTDIDEVFEKEAEQGGIRNLAEHMTCDAYTFPQVNLWRSERYYRIDNQYGDGIFTRLWRNNGKLRFDARPGLHQKQCPDGIGQVCDSSYRVIHYGFADDKNLLDKYHTYKAHGQVDWALERLIDESTLTLGKTDPAWLGREPKGRFIEQLTQLRNML